LIENVKPSIGISSVDTVKYYIDRTIQFRKQAGNSLTKQGETQPAPRGKFLQEMRDKFPHLEENLERGNATYWKPRTLIEGDGQIILVTNEPGMGKSTLLSHLAKETRIDAP
jgi:predicted ATP-dependent serine protease